MSNVVSEAARRHMTVEQYLAFELRSPSRHEYLAGEVFAMTASGSQHNALAARLFAATTAHLRGSVWQAFPSEVKFRVRTNMRDYFCGSDRARNRKHRSARAMAASDLSRARGLG